MTRLQDSMRAPNSPGRTKSAPLFGSVTAAVALSLASVTAGSAAAAPRTQLSAHSAAAVTPAVTRSVRPKPNTILYGGDVSWPNCSPTKGGLPKRIPKGLPMPTTGAKFISIGLTNGPGFYANPCVDDQVAYAKARHMWTTAYAFTTLPNAGQVAKYGNTGPWTSTSTYWRTRNASYTEAQINIATLKRVGLKSPIVWLDVETEEYLESWSKNTALNRIVLSSVTLAYRHAGYQVGLYSSDYEWKMITGGLTMKVPTIVTVGGRGRTAALRKCSAPAYSRGPAILTQWWDATRDYDVTCPGVTGTKTRPGQMLKYFAAN